MTYPLLSVVVPTHNRSQYAISCIEAILAIGCPTIELIITDTSTDNTLYDLLHDPSCKFLDDPRFIYQPIRARSNLTKNHNDAVALARGEYVCIIGDDDCLTSAAIDAAKWAAANQVSVVSQTQTSIYAWPDFRSTMVRAGHASRLYVPRGVGGARWRDAKLDLKAGLTRALQSTESLPRCYHGIVRRELLEQVRERTGTYFHGSSPDMSGAVAMACLVDRYCEVDLPLSISGISSGSNSGRSAMNTHKGELSAESQTDSFKNEGWTPGVPRFFAVETVWAHAGLETLRRLSSETIAEFNYARLLALCSIRHPEFREKTEHAVGEVNALLGRDISAEIDRQIRLVRMERWAYLIRRGLIPTVANGRRFFKDLPTVAAASKRYEQYAQRMGLCFRPPASFGQA